jgi:transcriptional regulator with XRE-family HTH domain
MQHVTADEQKEGGSMPKHINEMRIARIKRGLSQRDMAQMLNVTQATYSRTENGVTEPSDELLERIVEILRVPKNRLLQTASSSVAPEKAEKGVLRQQPYEPLQERAS